MEFVTVSTRLWKDRWVRSLGMEWKLLWVYLCTCGESDYGFLEYDPELWAIETGLTVRQVELICESFVSDSKIARESDLLLVVKAIQHRRLGARDYEYAVNAINRRYGLRAPTLVSLCLQRNPTDSGGIHGTPALSISISQSEQNQNLSSRSAKRAKKTPERSYESLRNDLAPECQIAWDSFIRMGESKNKTYAVADTKKARFLDALLTRMQDRGLTVEQANYGLTAALTANGGEGVFNINYVLKAAEGYNGNAS